MTGWTYIVASLRHYRRAHWAVAAGVAVATAVITGALIVGDSVRHSLRQAALAGLGRADLALVAEHPFREALAVEWQDAAQAKQDIGESAPILLMPGSVSCVVNGSTRRVTQLQAIGVTPAFWTMAIDATGAPKLGRRDIALPSSLARELNAVEGDSILLRLPRTRSIPADSTLGDKGDGFVSRRLTVSAVLPDDDRGMSRFSLRPTLTPARNVFVALATMQDMLELPDRVNALIIARPAVANSVPDSPETLARLERSLRPRLADFGVNVVEAGPAGAPERRYVRISADRLVLPPAVVESARRLFGDQGLQGAITYLANSISAGQRRIPYSTVVGVDSTPALDPVVDDAGNPLALAADEIALNDWAATDLQAAVGDTVALRWYDPETTHGELQEHAPLELKVRAIVSLVGADDAPTAAADPDFAPELPGVTDQASIDAWDLPFELVEPIRDQDEAYWNERRTTPKAFISHELAAKLWSTRWGVDSVLRIPLTGGATADAVAEKLAEQLEPAALGMHLVPIRAQALAASRGTTPFDGLFLGFSFLLMASALLLVWLLFRLGVERRAGEVGLLLACGLSPQRVRWLLLGEGALVAVAGAAGGVAAGAAYARLMVHGLNTWWNDALAAPFLRYHAEPRSLLIGFSAGVMVALGVMAWSLRRFARTPARRLLAGSFDSAAPVGAGRWTGRYLPVACLVLAPGLSLLATQLEGEARAGAFVGGGLLILLGLLAAVRARLHAAVAPRLQKLTLAGMALGNARRHPSRTLLSLALAATASFLIVALSAFRLAPTDRGTGGFDLLATADLPLHYNLNSREGRRELGFSEADSERLQHCEIVGFRVRDGEDASCLNLYQTVQPRVLGAPPALAASSRFQWASLADIAPALDASGDAAIATDAESRAGWDLLDVTLPEGAVPMALDRNTAMYSLKLFRVGDELTLRDAAQGDAKLQVVGMLSNSVLQGDVIVSERHFLSLFPETAGYRFFLIRGGPGAPPTDELASLLETQLEDFGFDAVDARARLAELLAVQNTYLSTFQSLGALGLLLGMAGLAVAQLRSAHERRGELALLKASGFSQQRLTAMVLIENLSLMAGGLAIGGAAALVAVAPQALVEQVGAPWLTIFGLLAAVASAGVVAARIAAAAALRAPLVPALRGD